MSQTTLSVNAAEALHKEILAECQRIYYDVRLSAIAEWKKQDPKRHKAVAYLPVYVPREVFSACGIRPVATFGGGDQINVIRGDSFYQSYICHLPRSVVELGLTSWKDALDGLVSPAICDVIRNVSGVWKVLFPDKLSFFLDLPQNFGKTGAKFYRRQLEEMCEHFFKISGSKVDMDKFREAIAAYNKNRRAIRELANLRVEKPHYVPAWEYYLLVRAGDQMDVERHTELIGKYIDCVNDLKRAEQDNARIMIVGGFCEQPPLNLIRTIERSGCYLVEDDFTLGSRFLEADADESIDPFDAIVDVYLKHSTYSSVKYEENLPKSQRLVGTVRAKKADGVLLMSPSFCDPSLLDRPHYQRALEEAGIPFSTLQYAENLGQFAPIREQTGTFAEAIKLWGEG